MALVTCPDCGGEVSDLAPACPHCGRPMGSGSVSTRGGDTRCPHCNRMVTPVVTSVGGGSCSVGRREKWTCPACKRTIRRSGCFVATVAYGDEDILEVELLRRFRDRYLAHTVTGRVFITSYYWLGPYVAAVVECVPLFRSLARRTLDLVVVVIELATSLNRDSCADELRRKMET